jgi:peptidoglycan lytic transglycosylase
LSRPNIRGRALRALLAPLAIVWLAALSLVPASIVADAAPVAAVAIAGNAASLAVASTAAATPPTGAGVGVGVGGAGLLQAGAGAPPLGGLARARLAFKGVRADLSVLEGHAASVSGALRPGRGGRLVELQRRAGHGWRTLARAFTGARGRFRLRYTPWRLSEQRLRLLFPGDGRAAPRARRLGLLSVFRLAGASWYGGGGSLACGGWLTGSTLGVANKTLPCGTLVTLRYGSRSVRVPVVDRGPYVAGREFDLTEATKRALGFEGVGEVWSSR